ncbi:hypothetical protein AUCHE_04_01110 [Austwickia chelonae NBRC 105200]|uniref:CAAX prenyl protease 2/Lysostaphin resistance protein A-like domain-containing protein n=2 Tax=Austwickia TaxID=1184606 RepID=K6VNY8_9MICO|nr:hypothetical protein AUCHE_04_01110 [Austwickia chelonae NBRC 105200]
MPVGGHPAAEPSPLPVRKLVAITVGLSLIWPAVSLMFSPITPGSYSDFFHDPLRLFLRAGVPMMCTAVVITLFLKRHGTFDRLWREPPSMPQPTWWMFAIAFIPAAAGAHGVVLQTINLFQDKAAFVLATVPTMLAVGYAEEIFFRGFLIDEMRRANVDEVKVAVISSALFGLWHAPNFLVGTELVQLITQLITTSIAGLAFYFIRRATGLLWPGMLVHACFDMQAAARFLAMGNG